MTKKRQGKRKDPHSNRLTEIMKWEATNELTPFTIKDGFTAAHSWELPEAYVCIVRANWENEHIEERAYRSPQAANRFMRKCLETDANFTLLTDEAIKDTIPHDQPYDDDLF
jgi:hypothetical protein